MSRGGSLPGRNRYRYRHRGGISPRTDTDSDTDADSDSGAAEQRAEASACSARAVPLSPDFVAGRTDLQRDSSSWRSNFSDSPFLRPTAYGLQPTAGAARSDPSKLWLRPRGRAMRDPPNTKRGGVRSDLEEMKSGKPKTGDEQAASAAAPPNARFPRLQCCSEQRNKCRRSWT